MNVMIYIIFEFVVVGIFDVKLLMFWVICFERSDVGVEVFEI